MNNTVYFKNLHALRFIAALIVLISHVGQFGSFLGISTKFTPQINAPAAGETGVLLFFVLSGFLITYLLLTEKNKYTTVNVLAFYKRRALRIWPLYFLVISLALFVLPFIHFLQYQSYNAEAVWQRLPLKILFYCLLVPNVVMDFIGLVPYAAHTWTIGAEEQFYFLWPLLVKKNKNILLLCVTVLLLYIVLGFFITAYKHNSKILIAVYNLWVHFPVSCMAVGGIYAWLVFKDGALNNKIKQFVFSKASQIVLLSTTILLVMLKINFKWCNRELYAVLLGYVVCNFAANPKPLFNMEYKILVYLGKISFGIYMFHPLAIACSYKICVTIHTADSIVLYALSIGISLLLAMLSWHTLERYFIKQKIKYSPIISGDNAHVSSIT